MKFKFKHSSKATLITIALSVCLIVSCMAVGVIATDAAKVAERISVTEKTAQADLNTSETEENNTPKASSKDDEALGASAGDENIGAVDDSEAVGATTKVYFRNNDNWSNVYILTSSNINMNDSNGYKWDVWGSGLTTATQMTVVPGETNVYQADITLTNNKVVFVSNTSSQGGYLNDCGNCVARDDYATGKIVNAWDSSNNNNKVGNKNSTDYWKSNLEDYTPPVIYTTTIYIKSNLKNKNNGGPLTNAYIWSNSDDKWTGNWPGEAISGWTASGSYYYKSFTNTYSKFKVILQGNNAQTDDSAEYNTGKTYRIDSVNTSGSNGQAVLTEGVPATPACTSVSLAKTSPASGSIYTGETSVTYTATATGAQSGVTYVFKVDGTQVQSGSSPTYTTTFNSAGTKNVTVTVEKSGYESVTSSAVSTTVVNRPSVHLVGGFRPDHWEATDNNKMTYNSTDNCWYVEQDLNATYSYPQNGDWGFGVSINRGGTKTFYNNSGTMSSSNCTNWHFETGKQNCGITPSLTGTYIFKVTLASEDADPYVSLLYPHSVSFNTKGGSSVSSQVVKYKGKATRPSPDPTKTGYTFDKWVTTDGGSTEFNFTNTAITTNTTIYATWTVNSHSITYPSTTTGYSLDGPASANYGTSVSFTVTADTGYRIKSVTYTYGSTTANCLAGSNNEYHFSMPDANVTVSVEAVSQYTVTLTTSTNDLNNNPLSATAGFDSRSYSIDGGTQKGYTQAFKVDSGSTVTFSITYNAGYSFFSVTNATDVNNAHQTFTVTVSADTTVTLVAKEESHTVTVYKRLNRQDGVYSTTTVQTIENIGAATQGTVLAADATSNSGDYSFTSFTFDNTVITGSPSGRSAFSITTTADSEIYIDYNEVLYTLTINVSPSGKGSVKKDGVAYTSLQVGNVTGAVLTAVPIAGYQFSSWTQTGTPTTTAPSTATYNKIRIKGNTTLTANFEEITHTITLKKRYWLVEGDTQKQLDSGVDLGITFSGAGMYTPIEITAPKVRNCSFMKFDLNNSAATLVSGYELTNNPIEVKATADATIYVDYKVSGNIDIYVDMNDNVGTPILNIMYFADSNGNPVEYTSVDGNGNPVQPAGSTIAYLPYEMELVTGSESIYKYTLKVPKLREDYKIGKHIQNNVTILDLINISYITVENVKIGENSGFKIDPEAYATGEMWLKADSTKLTTFNTLSYGSVTNSFIGLFDDGNSNSTYTKLDSAIKSVNGTSIHTDDDEIYHAQYAGLYRVTKNNVTTLINNFHYTLNVSLNQEVTQNGTTYYFDRWIKCPAANLSATNGAYSFSNSSPVEGDPESPDLNFTHALEYSDGDYAYIALYKPASNSEVRVEVTYNFKDFNSADGNYIYEADKTVPASYTKTIRVPVGTGQTYADFAAVQAAVNAIASANVPYVKSNYFNYSYKANSATVDNDKTSSAESKIVATAELEETARVYTIIVKDGNSVKATETGYYQQSVTLTNNKQNPVWEDNAGNIIATGATYKAIFVSNANDNNGTDCQIIKIDTQANASVTNKSVVQNSFTEVYYDGSTEKLRHNFYIIDYCTEGTLLGGGVLYATTDGTDYRQSSAATNLGAYATPTSQASITTRTNFITNILKAGTQTIDYSTEYKAQTIDNIGFRYKPFKSTEDVFRYSDDLGAYLTMFEGTNVNSSDYDGQKLRLFSFMLYNNNGTTVVVPSDGYAEVSRYQQQSQS